MDTSQTQSYEERILRVLVHIQSHLSETLELDDLARVAHFSPFHFHRVFRGMVGESLKSHIRRLRLERAAHVLKHSEQPVTRIAFDAGYETHEAFTRAFKTMFDMPPKQFREVHQPVPFEDVPSGVHYSADGRITSFRPLTPGDKPMDVEIKRLAPLRVAFVRHVGPYMGVGAAWGRLCAWAGPRGILGPNTRFLGICHDDPEVTPPDKIRYDACVTVGDDVKAEGDIGIQETIPGDYAVTLHRGPYENLKDTYAKLAGQWLPTSKRELRHAPSIEFYRNSPQDTPPENLMTDVCMALEDK